jgi:transposase
MLPQTDFITTLFNVHPDEIESLETVKQESTFHYHIRLNLKRLTCPYCSEPAISHGQKEKIIHHPNVIDFDGIIHYYARRYICKDCRRTFFEVNPFSFPGFNNSYALMDRVMKQLSQLDLSFKRIAELNHISVTTVQYYLDSHVFIPTPSLPENLGIDELYSNMSYHDSAYLCILIDNENRYPIDVLNSRSKNHLNNHFSQYSKDQRDKVKFVTIDMWEPYRDVALRQFKQCKVAVDPFHVVKNLSFAFSKIRISMMNQCIYNSDGYYLLKRWHILLDKKEIDLDDEPTYNQHFLRKLNKRQLLEMIFSISDKLLDAYNLKTAYQFFNDTATYENAGPWLDQLIHRFQTSGIVEYDEFTRMLIHWREEIINSFQRPHHDRKQSNALAENVNSQLRIYIALIRGSQNFTRFRKRVLYALNPKIFYAISSRLTSDKQSKKTKKKEKEF